MNYINSKYTTLLTSKERGSVLPLLVKPWLAFKTKKKKLHKISLFSIVILAIICLYPLINFMRALFKQIILVWTWILSFDIFKIKVCYLNKILINGIILKILLNYCVDCFFIEEFLCTAGRCTYCTVQKGYPATPILLPASLQISDASLFHEFHEDR